MQFNKNRICLAIYAKKNFHQFVICLREIILKKKFDAILVAGNSGLGMGVFTQMIYKELGLTAPPIIPVAVFREGNRLTNEIKKVHISTINELRTYLPNKFPTGNVLIVDDEIGVGRVTTAAIRLLTKVAGRKFKFTLLAENHGYNPKIAAPKFHIEFVPFANKRPGYFGVIFFVMPAKIQNKINLAIGNQEDTIKYATNLLLDLPIKEPINGHWKFVHKYDNLVRERIKNFKNLQIQYRRRLKALIKIALKNNNTPKFYQPPGFNFNDFDLLVNGGKLYAVFVKKFPYPKDAKDAKLPNRLALAKTSDGKIWEEVGDIIKPVPNSWEETIWAGCVSRQKNKFVVYYTGTTVKGRNNFCKIGKAYSNDLVHWEKDTANPVFIFDPSNHYYSAESKLSFRDPFFFEYKNKKYIIFCAKDKRRPNGRRGCVGIAEEVRPNKFRWMPPLFSPGIYPDGLECPALYQIDKNWYLLYGLDTENGGRSFRYAVSQSPFGPFIAPTPNELTSGDDYVCRIIKFKGNQLLYYWQRDYPKNLMRERLAPPKKVDISPRGKILLSNVTL